MKKKILIIVGIIIVVSIIICLKFIKFGNHKTNQTEISLTVPNMSVFKKEIENEDSTYSISFKSFSSIITLNSELNAITNEYEKYYCNNSNYYYDIDNDITITNYGVEIGFPLNTFFIDYYIGKYYNSDCGKINSSKDLSYIIVPVNSTGYCYINNEFKYLNEDGNKYTVHYNCFGNLAFRNGLDKMTYIDDMLAYSWSSMKDIIDFLDYQVKNNEATKTNFDNGSILYKNKDFSLLKCDTKNGNKDVYIGSPKVDYNDTYCK